MPVWKIKFDKALSTVVQCARKHDKRPLIVWEIYHGNLYSDIHAHIQLASTDL